MDNINLVDLKMHHVLSMGVESEYKNELKAKQQPLNEAIQALQEKFEVENSELITNTELAIKEASDAKTALQEAIVNSYDKDNLDEKGKPIKQFGGGLSVQVDVNLEYDASKAVDWAISHNMPNVLNINKVKFKELASIQDFDFVEKVDKVIAKISLK